MRRLMKYFRGYRARAAVAPFFKLAEALLELLIPGIVAALIDDGVAAADAAVIWRKCGIMALIGAAGLALSACSQWFSASAAVGFSCALREDLFGRVLRLPAEQSDRVGGSALLTRLTSDVDRLQNGINLTLRLLLRSPFVVFGAVVMAVMTDRQTGIWFVAAVPVLAAVIFTVILGGIPLHAAVGRKLDSLTGAVRDSLRGVRVIRAFRGEERSEESFGRLNRENEKASSAAGAFSALLNPLTFALLNILVILVIRTGSVGIESGRLTGGQLVALYNYTAMILTELVKLADLSLRITKSAACARRIADVLDLPVEDDGGAAAVEPVPGSPALEFEDAGFRYPGSRADSLEPLSFSLSRGGTLGIIGGTGSGKSTLVSLIERIYEPTTGHIRLFGRDVRDYPLRELRRMVAFVPQDAKLFSGTVAENVRWGRPGATDEEVTEALRAAGALDFVMAREGGIDCPTGQGGSNFSGGQRQRLTIARALISGAPLLVLDDSFSALDYGTERLVRNNVTRADGRPAVIIISQRQPSVEECDTILVLEDGRCDGLGTHADLLESSPVYREIFAARGGSSAGGPAANREATA
jgi:ABC-type multidrug transport system fused ATPase/permease subunit